MFVHKNLNFHISTLEHFISKIILLHVLISASKNKQNKTWPYFEWQLCVATGLLPRIQFHLMHCIFIGRLCPLEVSSKPKQI